MRISSNLFFQTGVNAINAQQSDLVHLYKQVGSGQRMVTPSDDPLAAAKAINVSQTLAMSERYAANRAVANRNLGMQENILNSVTLQLQDVKTRLVEAGNGTMSDLDRASLAEVLETTRDGLVNLANSTDGNGQYLFSGAKGDTAPYAYVLVDPEGPEDGPKTWKYQGSDNERLVQVDQTRQMNSADTGLKIFAPGGDEENLFNVLDKMVAALRAPQTDAAAADQYRDALDQTMRDIDSIYDNILSVRSSSGTRMNEISALEASGSGRILDYKKQLSELEDLDYYTAITQLQLRTSALEAASMAFQKIQNTSMFNLAR